MSELKLEVGKKYIVEPNPELMLVLEIYELPIEIIYITDTQVCFKHPALGLGILRLNEYIFSEYTEPEKLEGWFNLYRAKTGKVIIGGTIYDSKEHAMIVAAASNWKYIRSIDLSKIDLE